jgi:hypothetical protein
MPIRFRCVYCDQLLGIAKRKAGSVVKCPNCAGQLIVPSPSPSEDSSDTDMPTAAAEDVVAHPAATSSDKTAHSPPPGEGPGMLFERTDFDELLKPAIERREPALAGQGHRGRKQAAPAMMPASSPAPAPPHAPAPAFDFSAAPAAVPAQAAARRTSAGAATSASARSGIMLTPIKLILLSVLVMVGMAFAFGGGVLLGWYLHK